ncbi:MAG: hypothetical protein IK016_10115 [Lachnospiraceae bacterium]|nr:hypothetical protein [Lachnospiraceae bacterium]
MRNAAGKQAVFFLYKNDLSVTAVCDLGHKIMQNCSLEKINILQNLMSRDPEIRSRTGIRDLLPEKRVKIAKKKSFL